MSMPGENATPATQSEGLADAIHELLSQPESFLDRTGDPEKPHSVPELPDGTTVYTLPGAQIAVQMLPAVCLNSTMLTSI